MRERESGGTWATERERNGELCVRVSACVCLCACIWIRVKAKDVLYL